MTETRLLLKSLALVLLGHCLVLGQPQQGPANSQSGPTTVRFSFSGAPWRSVIQWLADSGDYALHVNDLPLGSFSYSDSRSYTIDEAINRINMFLIPQQYTIVRSERLLSVISLVSETSLRQLDAMSRTVTPDQLANLGSHEFVKCFFPLGDIAAEHAKEELASLMLVRPPSVLKNTNQLMIMDIAEKQRSVAKILSQLSTPDAKNGSVKRFDLAGLDLEKSLIQIRPHVGLDPLGMIGADIRLSIDKDRQQLLASGSDDNLRTIASVIALLREANQDIPITKDLVFRTHDVGDAELQTVVNVLQTLLAEEDVRLAPDPGSNQLVIYGNQEVHDVVKQTIDELTGTFDSLEFKVFQVSTVDAHYAAIVLNDMFGSANTSAEDEGVMASAPRIDADSASGRIFVRARKKQLAEIEAALTQFANDAGPDGLPIRLLPYQKSDVHSLMETLQRLWPYDDRIEFSPGARRPGAAPIERPLNADPAADQDSNQSDVQVTGQSADQSTLRKTDVSGKLVSHQRPVESPLALQSHGGSSSDASTGLAGGDESKIRVQPAPGGLLVHAADAAAVDRFERHFRLVGGDRASRRELAIFYLQHAKVKAADMLLRQLLDSQQVSSAGTPRGLARLSVPPEIMGIGGDMDSIWRFNSATIISDPRLNRFFVYGSAKEIETIETHLKFIDRENSIVDLKTHGTPKTIHLRHAKAEEVAAVIRDAYAGRIAASAKERVAAAQREERDQNRRPRDTEDASRERRSPAQQPNDQEETMTLAVDVTSNTIVVTAPDQLAREVEALAESIDMESQRSVRVIPMKFGGPKSQEDIARILSSASGSQRPGR